MKNNHIDLIEVKYVITEINHLINQLNCQKDKPEDKISALEGKL